MVYMETLCPLIAGIFRARNENPAEYYSKTIVHSELGFPD